MNNKEKEIKRDIERNGAQHVSLVAPLWPPRWLASSSAQIASVAGPEAQSGAGAVPARSRGWLLPSGVVLCASCNAHPVGAADVRLVEQGGELRWVECEHLAAEAAASDGAENHPVGTSSAADERGAEPSNPNDNRGEAVSHPEPKWL